MKYLFRRVGVASSKPTWQLKGKNRKDGVAVGHAGDKSGERFATS